MTSSFRNNQQRNAGKNAESSDSQCENTATASPKMPAAQRQQRLSDPNHTPRPNTQPPTKQSYRERVWQHLQYHRLAQFPLPARGRIPNVLGSDQAVQQHLRSLPVWQRARTVCVNVDKAQESVRAAVLKDGKELYVPVPRVEGGFLRRLIMAGDSMEEVKEGEEKEKGKKYQQFLRQAVNRRGLEENGTIIPYASTHPTPISDVDDVTDSLPPPAPLALPQLDLVVVGTVAVSRANGRHIGKGRGGNADLEYGILGALGTLTIDTKIITVVHDCQVFNDLPDELFNEHDVSVDYIVTPTGVIDVTAAGNERPERPFGVYWPLVSNRRLNLMPVLHYLHEQKQGVDTNVTLKDEDTDIESRELPRMRRRFLRRRRNVSPPPRNNPNPTVSDNAEHRATEAPSGDGKENLKPQRRRVSSRFFRRPRVPKDANNVADSSAESGRDGAASANLQQPNPRQGRRNYQGRRPFTRLRPYLIDFSLKVSNIERSVRVRDLKQALVERGIKPQIITWVGYKGFCLLHYAKPRPPQQNNTHSSPSTPTNAPTPTTDGEVREEQDRELLKESSNVDKQQIENGRSKEINKGEVRAGTNGHVTVKQFVLDDVIEILQNMRIHPDSETSLDVTVMKPLPDKQQRQQQQADSTAIATVSPIPNRIETTDVSAV